MATVEQVNGILDKIISAGEYLAVLIPGKVDDLLFAIAKFARQDAVLQGWLATALEPDPTAYTAPPEVLVEATYRFENETGMALTAPGSRLQAIMAILQILAEIRKYFPAS